jgi:predicted ATPase
LALEHLAHAGNIGANTVRSATTAHDSAVEVSFDWVEHGASLNHSIQYGSGVRTVPTTTPDFDRTFRTAMVFRFDPIAIRDPAPLTSVLRIDSAGKGLAGVFDRLSTRHLDQWSSLNDEIGSWFPEFDRISLDTNAQGHRTFSLGVADRDSHEIPADQLSDGVLISLAMLALSHLPNPPKLIGIEEPERGIHPRLLKDVFNAIMRLTHPEEFGDRRDPVQVIATTHSPYLLGYFRDRPEDVVIANREGDNVRFERLADIANYDEIVGDVSLGEAWYTGVFGGVPTR